jgi:hypothetical protein
MCPDVPSTAVNRFWPAGQLCLSFYASIHSILHPCIEGILHARNQTYAANVWHQTEQYSSWVRLDEGTSSSPASSHACLPQARCTSQGPTGFEKNYGDAFGHCRRLCSGLRALAFHITTCSRSGLTRATRSDGHALGSAFASQSRQSWSIILILRDCMCPRLVLLHLRS